MHSTSEARALGVKPAPFRVRTSPPDTLRHRLITVPTPVPDTGVVLQVAPLDDDVTVADSMGVAAAAMVEVPMSAPPDMSATTPTVASALVSLICNTAPPNAAFTAATCDQGRWPHSDSVQHAVSPGEILKTGDIPVGEGNGPGTGERHRLKLRSRMARLLAEDSPESTGQCARLHIRWGYASCPSGAVAYPRDFDPPNLGHQRISWHNASRACSTSTAGSA